MKKQFLLFFIVIAIGAVRFHSYAQKTISDSLYDIKANDIINSLKEGNLDGARILSDELVLDEKSFDKSESWYLRGFMYKELYKKYSKEKPVLADGYREISYQSFVKAIELSKEDSIGVQENKLNLKFLASRYYNDAGQNLTIVGYVKSENYFKKYEKLMSYMDTKYDSKKDEISYYNALGSVFTNEIAKYKNDKGYHYAKLAKIAFQTVLLIDSTHIPARYNLLNIENIVSQIDNKILKDKSEQLKNKNQINELTIKENQTQIEKQNLESEKKTKELELIQKEKETQEIEAKRQKQVRTIFIIASLLLLLLLGAIYNSNSKTKKANKEITKQKELIEAKQKEILDSIRYAKRIQQALLPTEKYIDKSLKRLKNKL